MRFSHLARLSALAYSDDRDAARAQAARLGYDTLCLLRAPATDTEALILHDADERRIVLAFRGTEASEPRDIVTDLKARRREVAGIGGGISVHRGFLDAWRSIRPAVERHLRDIRGPGALWITGHSLGGALAQIAALDLIPAGVVTFGAPRVGNGPFVAELERRVRAIWRISRGADVVPLLPPLAVGYRHAGRHVYLPAGDGPALYDVGLWAEIGCRLRALATTEWTPVAGLPLPTAMVGDHAIDGYVRALEARDL